MKIFKGYVKNLYRPKASIVEKYIAGKQLSFVPRICQKYMI